MKKQRWNTLEEYFKRGKTGRSDTIDVILHNQVINIDFHVHSADKCVRPPGPLDRIPASGLPSEDLVRTLSILR